jgi:recyclin-1
MTTYKPAEHEEMTSVAPLLQFFESVHIGDTTQSTVQVYFDKELVCMFFFSLFLLSIC